MGSEAVYIEHDTRSIKTAYEQKIRLAPVVL